MIIYVATCMVNCKRYVGKTVSDLAQRRRHHHSQADRAGRGTARDSYFYKAIRKHGKDAFTWSVVKTCASLTELNQSEKDLIDAYGTRDRKRGYNIAPGGTGGDVLGAKGKTYEQLYGPEEAARLRALRSSALKGKPKSAAHCKNLSLANTGRKFSAAVCAERSRRMKGDKNHFFGRKHSVATRRLIGSKSVGRNWYSGPRPERRKIPCLT
jgi:group I intron endonuclease